MCGPGAFPQCDSHSPAFSELEQSTLVGLVEAYLALHHNDDGTVLTDSDEAYDACQAFLSELEGTVLTLNAETAPRAYRDGFAINYKSYFEREALDYRTDILVASTYETAGMPVNGQLFPFTTAVEDAGKAVQQALKHVALVLEKVEFSAASSEWPSKDLVVCILSGFDHAWAVFESSYITELSGIEASCRQPVLEAAGLARRLKALEQSNGGPEEAWELANYKLTQEQLVSLIANINRVANPSAEWRENCKSLLEVNVLERAQEVLAHPREAALSFSQTRQEGSGDAEDYDASAALTVARRVLRSFEAMCRYFITAETVIDDVDPELSNNAGLVARLGTWEAAWKVGRNMFQQQGVVNAFCELVGEVRYAQHLVPDFETMVQELDAELFLILPRLTWLKFLRMPVDMATLIQRYLPHETLEISSQSFSTGSSLTCSPKMEAFCEQYARLMETLGAESKNTAEGEGASQRPLRLLMNRVVVGQHDGTQHLLAEGLSSAALAEMEAFVMHLEEWSMVLQRTYADDWNSLTAILQDCISNEEVEVDHRFCCDSVVIAGVFTL
eukprot:TRINITY_DN13923_c0_g3_i1.p1 TRINITY_DN13923_c0_g3~~TRINITY_DN13923_c0_g3_i1.p1  ORF type:complete len:560 (-),score=110.68 TRINITY_DN13923_c0_g3_i1:94-1773(-)